MILKSGAGPRRRLGDSVLCQLRPNYDAALTEYNRILEQKSRILKDHFENPALLEVPPEKVYYDPKVEYHEPKVAKAAQGQSVSA